MDGPGIGIQAGQKATYERAQHAYEGARLGRDEGELRKRSETKFGELISDGDGLCKLIAELAQRADRIADIIDGPAPPSVEPASERAPEHCLPDAINARFARARAMTMQVHDTLSRIERRIG